MHELAHVRRWDNFTRLLHRLVAAVLFFHPAVWLCGRMLRREAEQACDDLVVCATGRSEAYARGLAHVAERAAHLNPLIRRIPTMNAFAAAESDLALRIRRALGGGARRMGMQARVLTAVLLCPLAAVTLPSVSKISAESSQDEHPFIAVDQDGNMKLNDKSVTFATLKEELRAKRAESRRDERLFIIVDQDGNMKLNDKSVTFATLKEELRAKRRLLDNTTMIIIQGDERAPHGMIARTMDFARQVGLVDQVVATELQPEVANVAVEPSQNDGIWREAMATNPDEWSDELKTQLLALKPGSLSYEIATATSAELFIFNVVGDLVRTFFLDHQSPGKYSIVWDGRDDAGRERSNGVYFYTLKSDREANKHVAYRTILVR